mgnify:CR=1 FL=1
MKEKTMYANFQSHYFFDYLTKENKTVKIKQIKNFVDLGEFNTQDQRDQRKGRTLDKAQFEPRARSFTPPLEKVQEMKNEEERLAGTHLAERKWMELKDQDEFNTKDKKNKSKPSIEAEKLISEQKAVVEHTHKSRTCSLNLDEDPIPEEDAKEGRGRAGHFLPIHISSPKINKLKVDEIDFERNKSEFDQYMPEIDQEQMVIPENDVITEEASEYGQAMHGEEILEKGTLRSL